MPADFKLKEAGSLVLKKVAGAPGLAASSATLPNLADVQDALAPADGEILTYVSATGEWQAAAPGAVTETDPEVATTTNGNWCVGTGTQVTCTQSAPVTAESDPQVGTTTANNFCRANAGGTAVDCTTANITTTHIADDTIVAGDIAADAVGIAELSATGTADATTYLRGDGTWAAPAGGGGTPYFRTSIVTSGTTWTSPAGITSSTIFEFTVIGAGGGGGGGSNPGAAGGGGGGGTAIYSVSGLAPSTGYTIAIGAGGTGGSSGGGGFSGGNTTITINGTTITGSGGGGGANSGSCGTANGVTTCSQGGAGGTATNGTLNIRGEAGKNGSTAAVAGANGGSSAGYGTGGTGSLGGSNGGAGNGKGGGGGGGSGVNSGGVGAPGVIIVRAVY